MGTTDGTEPEAMMHLSKVRSSVPSADLTWTVSFAVKTAMPFFTVMP